MPTEHRCCRGAENWRMALAVSAVAAVLGLAGCSSSNGSGGGAGPAPPPPPPAATGIGPAGGTVTGSNGATMVVPAGALSQTVNLQITEIAASSASVPAGVQPASAIYALTPHGTTFAAPVTVTVPFDASRVPAGRTLQALKTTDTARTQWALLGGTTVSGSNASTQVSAFSDFLLAGAGPPTITTQPVAVSVTAGLSATFTIVADANGGPVLTYQWRRNGVAIAGATGPSYTLGAVAAGDDGARFTVVVGNGVGEVASGEAALAVIPAGPAVIGMAGRWSNDFRCVSSTGDVETGSEIIVVAQSGANVTLTSGPFSATGTIAGDVLTYSGSGPGYTEEGTWTRDGSDDRFAKASTYTNSPAIGGSGTCTGTLQRQAPSGAIAVAAGNNYSLAIRDDGTLWVWGWNIGGELGLGADRIGERVLVPTQVGAESNWRHISAGGHTMALRADGTLWAWGDNFNGLLGDGTTTGRPSPVRIGMDSNWRAISASSHTVALRTDGTLWAWGPNGQGQLGDGTNDQRLIPTQIGIESDWIAIAAGREHTVAVKSDGSLWAWGSNANGQLGDGTTSSRPVPTRIGAANDWTAVAASIRFTLAIRADGTLWAWGENNNGQLGDGTVSQRLVPTRVGADSDWVSVAAGKFNTSLAIKSDGSLWTWGNNGSGQLGNGTTANSTTPLRVGVANNWSAVVAGSGHVVGIQTDGTLWTWGYNLNGELGDGTRTGKLVPTQVPF